MYFLIFQIIDHNNYINNNNNNNNDNNNNSKKKKKKNLFVTYKQVHTFRAYTELEDFSPW